MFRLWGKIWKDNHLVQDAVAEEAGDDTRTHKVFTRWMSSAGNLILAGRSGWNAISGSFSGTVRPDFIRTALSRRLILIIWKFRYWRNDFESM